MPLYMHYMGAEAFGLIGFFLMMQTWMQLLDLGLSPTLSREMSLYRAGLIDTDAAWQRLRSLECLLGMIAFIAVTALVMFRRWIAEDWLTFRELSQIEISRCIIAMATAAGLRWLMGIYRSGLIGLERQLWVNRATAVFASLKFIGVLPILIYFSVKPLFFFIHQAVIGGIELVVFARMMYRALPGRAVRVLPTSQVIKSMMPMAGAMAFSAGMWSFITQIDKIVLSKLLSLEAYGYFTLAVMMAGGVLVLIPPLNQVLQPRMTILASQGRQVDLCILYKRATQMVTAVFLSLGGVLSFFAQPVLFAWTSDLHAATVAAPILFWYGLANATIGILLLPFLLQFAHGYLRLHVIGNLIMGITLLPMVIFASIKFGGAGAGATLLIVNLLFIVLWIPKVHKKLMPDVIWTWLLFDVGKVAGPIVAILALSYHFLPDVENRLFMVFIVIFIFVTTLLIGLLIGDRSRTVVTGWIKSFTWIGH